MFDGVPVEHFHRFMSTPSSTIPPNSSLIQTPPIATSTNLSFLSFDPIIFPPLHTHQTLFQSNHFDRTPPTPDQYNDSQGNKVDQEIDPGVDVNYEPWSNNEVIQLLRLKSSSENWFKDFTWDHVSRKLAEMGYKRSPVECKDKFEEETCRSFSSTIKCNKSSSSSNNRYLITTEDQLHHHLCNTSHQNTLHHATIESPENIIHQEQPQQEKQVENLESQGQIGHFEKDPNAQPTTDQNDEQLVTKSKKRKRKHKMVKGLCIDLVTKMMSQQEEMHKKLLEDMVKRDEEKAKREEAWRKEEMERMQMEFQIRQQEQEMARDRQSTITEVLNKITSLDKKIQIPLEINLQDLQAIATNIDKPMSLSEITTVPSLENVTENRNQDHQAIAKDDIGKRWPREEVLALINIRTNIGSNVGIGGNNEEHNAKGSLWERIAQGMLEMGYKRSAKRCKEKWENINKYFRKTKDANKKRSLESRTCPYYYELSKLYNQEKLATLSNSAIEDQLDTTITRNI